MRKPLIIALAVVALMILVPAAVLGGFALADRGSDRGDRHYSGSSDGDPTPWLGVSIADLNEKLASRLDLAQESGVVVLHVIADSPAADAGLQRGDIIASVGGESVDSAKDVAQAVRDASPDDVLTLSVQRDDSTLSIDVTIGEHPWKNAGRRRSSGPATSGPWMGTCSERTSPWRTPMASPSTSPSSQARSTPWAMAAPRSRPRTAPTDLSLTVGDGVHVSKGWEKVALDDLSSGDEVMVVLQDETLVALVARQENGGKARFHGRSGPKAYFFRSDRSGDRDMAEQTIQRLMQRMGDVRERSLRELPRDFERRFGQRLPNGERPQLAIPRRGG